MDRKPVIEAAQNYFRSLPKKEFIPGKTYVPASGKSLDENDLTALIEASLDMWLTTGRFGLEFEKRIPEYLGKKIPGLLVNSGSSANLLAISSLGSPLLKKIGLEPLKPGDEVITVAAGFPTTINPIIQNQWVPVFVDVNPETLCPDPEAIKRAKTDKTRAVVIAHPLGNPYRADLIAEWCKQEKLFFVEDCCDALGAEINGKPAGSYAHFSTLSFYPAHHITMGEGGIVAAQSIGLRRIAESIRDWGRDCWCEPGKDNTCGKRFDWKLGDLPCGYDHKYTYSQIGYNLKVTDMQASIGLTQLDKAHSFIEKRRTNWEFLNRAVESSKTLSEYFTPIKPNPGTKPSWFGFPILCKREGTRNPVIQFLESHQVGTRLVFGGNLTRQPAYANTLYRIAEPLTGTDRIMNDAFWIGLHPSLGEVELSYALEQLESAVKSLK